MLLRVVSAVEGVEFSKRALTAMQWVHTQLETQSRILSTLHN